MTQARHRYCILGLGNIGVLVSYFLRHKSPIAISRRGKGRKEKIVLRGEGGEIWSGEMLVYDIGAPVRCDFALLALKAYDIPWGISLLSGRAENVLILSNGLGLIEEASKALGRGRALASSITYGLTSCGDFCAELRGIGEIIIGGPGEEMTYEKALEISGDIERGGGIARAVERIEPYIWLKGIVNSAINPITAILNKPNGVLLENRNAMEIARMVALEGKSVAERKGVELFEEPFEAIIRVAERTRDNLSSMLQDVMNRRRTEIDFINGYIASEGMRLGIDARVNSTLYHLIKAVESYYLDKNFLKK
ncbi:MAG: ketopantoate reductase family protein [Fervidicoccaceae archaeon]